VTVVRKIAPIYIFIGILLAGCSQEDRTILKSCPAGSMDTFAGMLEYLQNQNIPALEKTEVWNSEYGGGLKLTTAHYEIFTTLSDPLMLRRIPLFMESAYRGYNSELPEPIETTNKFTIYLFADRQQWTAFTKGFAGEQADVFCSIKAGAYYLNGACVAYNIGRKRTFWALGHEGWHQFNSRLFKFRLPSWLDEGVAMLFESPQTKDGTFYFEPAENTYRLDALKKTLKNKMIPLKELIEISPGEVLATNESEQVLAFYSQSYALVRFLREGGFGKRMNNYRQLLLDGLRGDWPLDEVSKKIAEDRNQPRTVLWNRIVGQLLFQHYIGGDFDQLEQEYLAFCRQIVNKK
jgi:hypothetical protein